MKRKMNRLSTSCALAAGLIFGVVSVANANLVANGDFETGSYGGGSFQTLSAGSPNLTDWTIGSGSIDWIDSYWTAASGSKSIDLSGNGPAVISQSLNLTNNQTYSISFAYARNPDGAASQPFTVDLAGATGGITISNLAATTNPNTGWSNHLQTFLFTGTTGLYNLSFAASVNGAFGPALDNVSLTAVPLPAAAWLFGTALAGLGFARKYRRGEMLVA